MSSRSVWLFALAVAATACGDNSVNAVCGDQVCTAGESASSCAEDCGCGNGVANLDEQCDGTDFGTATCESVAQRGGTLRCNADCTFDVVGCDEYMCGNGIVEPGEDCDGTDFGDSTCATVGFSGGALACTAACRVDAAACCNNFCSEPDTTTCAGDTLRECTMQANGCLGLELTDCGAADDVCDDSGAVASCQCVDRCASVGIGHCAGTTAEVCAMQADGCLAWETVANCGTTQEACAVGPAGAACVADATGEDCADPYPLEEGQNLVAWTATTADYLTTNPSCSTFALTGGDVVLAYTAASNGIVTYSMPKLASQRHVIVVSNAATCGTVTAPTQASCVGNDFFAATTMGDTFAVTAGATYHFYVRDTTSGSSTLPSPMVLDIDEAACATITNAASNLSPANGAVLGTSSATLTFDLQHPIATNVGVITLTGNMGTTFSYDLATAQTSVTFTNGGRSVQIVPNARFVPGETITVTWSGIVDRFCAAPVPPPTWTFSILMPTCAPGVGGMVGTTQQRRAIGTGTFTEYYVAADTSPTGYVYVGGTSDLYRVPKAGGATENVVTTSGITSTPLGYSVAIAGNRVFTLDSVTSTTATAITRLTTSGGVTWNPLAYAQFGMTAGASPYGMWEDGGKIYVLTNETTSGSKSEIWSVSASAVSLPATLVKEGEFSEKNCESITGDSKYFYVTCDDSNDQIVRVDRTTFQSEAITVAIPLDATKNALHAHDFNADGMADALYVKSGDETVRYVCAPGGVAPFWQDTLVDFGGPTTTSNYGLGFDPVAKVLWAYDDDTQELISIQ